MFFNNMKLCVNAAVIIYGVAISFFLRFRLKLGRRVFCERLYSTYKMSFTGSLRAGVSLSGSSKKRSVHMVYCVLFFSKCIFFHLHFYTDCVFLCFNFLDSFLMVMLKCINQKPCLIKIMKLIQFNINLLKV